MKLRGVAVVFLLALLMLILANMATTIAHAEWTAPKVYSQTSLGSGPTPEIGFALSIECNQSAVRIFALDSANNLPLKNAYTFLKYIRETMIILSKNDTNESGYAIHNLPGQLKYMKNGRFIISIEKKGYLTRDIEFDISTCYGASVIQQPLQIPVANPPIDKAIAIAQDLTLPGMPKIDGEIKDKYSEDTNPALPQLQKTENNFELPDNAPQAIAIAVVITSLVLAFATISKATTSKTKLGSRLKPSTRSEKRWKNYENRGRFSGESKSS